MIKDKEFVSAETKEGASNSFSVNYLKNPNEMNVSLVFIFDFEEYLNAFFYFKFECSYWKRQS